MIREKYGYAESSNIKATKAGHIFDVVQEDTALENGMPVVLGELDEILEVRKATTPKAADEVVLVLSALVGTDDSTSTSIQEWFYRKEAGEVARAYELVKDDRFAVADYMIKPLSSKVEVGNTVTITESVPEGTKQFYTEVAHGSDTTTAGTNGFMARIEGVETKGELTLVRLRVLKNTPVAGA